MSERRAAAPRHQAGGHGLAACTRAPGRLDLFDVTERGTVRHRVWAGGAWTDEDLGGLPVATPAVTSWSADEMEVFAVFPDGELWDRYWDGAAWHAWESLGGELSGEVAASSAGADRLDVWARGEDGRLWHRWWDGERWVPWERLDPAVGEPQGEPPP